MQISQLQECLNRGNAQNVDSLCRAAPAAMRFVQLVILTIILAYPGDVLAKKKGKDKNGPCGKKYLRQIGGKCYYFAGKKMNWYGAQNNCLRKALNLADLSTAADFNAVVDYLKTRGNMEDFWFGGNDLQTEGRFTYIHSGRPVQYLGGVEKIEPTQRSNLDDCLEIRLRDNATTVTDDNCEEKQFFICAQNAGQCAQPSEDSSNNQAHSHEHLHHFHHDPTKSETEAPKKPRRSMESDSRPADNSNSTEVGESEEAGKEGEAGEEGGEEISEEEEKKSSTEVEGETNVNPDETTPTNEGETPTAAEAFAGEKERNAEAETPLPDWELSPPPADSVPTAAPRETEPSGEAPPSEGGEAPPSEGEKPSESSPAEGGEAPPSEGEKPSESSPAEGGEAPPSEGDKPSESTPAEGGEAPPSGVDEPSESPPAEELPSGVDEASESPPAEIPPSGVDEASESPPEARAPKAPITVDVSTKLADSAKTALNEAKSSPESQNRLTILSKNQPTN